MESVITHLIGGLGNQMFQYAAGYALSKRLGVALKFDISDFKEYKLHNGLEILRIFNCPFEYASQYEIEAILGRRTNFRLPDRAKLLAYNLLFPRHILIDRYRIREHFQNALAPAYMRGYWQDERYFRDYARDIRIIFSFSLALSDQSNMVLQKILQGNSISVHVRRGDYVTNPQNVAYLGATPISFYCSAIEYIAKKVDAPRFFVFSDDPEWAKSNIRTHYPTEYIDHNHGSCSFADMQLMSRCSHHIIANSSFSWWGAWLNPDPRKLVIGPRTWFANPRRLDNPCPPEWTLL